MSFNVGVEGHLVDIFGKILCTLCYCYIIIEEMSGI